MRRHLKLVLVGNCQKNRSAGVYSMSSEEILNDQADVVRPSEQEPAKKVVRRVTRKKSPVVASSTEVPADTPAAEKKQEELPSEPKKRGRPKGSTGAKSAPRARVAPKKKPVAKDDSSQLELIPSEKAQADTKAQQAPVTSVSFSQPAPDPKDQGQPSNQNQNQNRNPNQGQQRKSSQYGSRSSGRSQQSRSHTKGSYQKGQSYNQSQSMRQGQHDDSSNDLNIEEHPEAPVLNLTDYTNLSIDEVRKSGVAKGMNPDNILDLRKQEIIAEILRLHTAQGGVIVGVGTLEILPDGFGFLRSPANSYLSGLEDIYVSPAQIKSLYLKTGDVVKGQVRTPRDNERFFAILRILEVNDDEPIKAKMRVPFDSLTPLFPDERMRFETHEGDMAMRIIDMFCPIGKGQRSLIVAPPRTGKTVLLQKIANSISINHPDVVLMVLLVDERPEEVTDMRRHVKGEVIASTFDEQASRHVQVAEMVIEKAKRLVEHKKDVVILLDSITRLARAYNQTVPASGKILSGGVDSNALHKPKRFFGAARNIEFGGSLTIIATGLVETGSRMDEVIFEEFKGTGNNEIILDRRLADKRQFPAINIKKSGTRREDLLIPSDEAARIWLTRNAVGDMDDQEMTPFLIDKIRKTKDNEAFLRSINTGIPSNSAGY